MKTFSYSTSDDRLFLFTSHFGCFLIKNLEKFTKKMIGDNFGIHRGGVRNTAAANEERSGQVLSDFLVQLEDYTPTIPDAVTSYYLNSSGFDTSDPRIIRLISIAVQKFIADVANDALQHCKTRSSNTSSGSHASSKNQKGSKDRKYNLTTEDLAPALNDYGITVRKAHYFV
uniref:Uncharacterized protein n=1 Tax=Phlebotomus papatasi TaxID=29031 RepID=A0A1B0DH81_PHLPP